MSAALKGCFATAVFLLLCAMTLGLVRMGCYRKMQEAENREKVFLLYRNLRRLLKLAGIPGDWSPDSDGFRKEIQRRYPKVAEEELQIWRKILEQCSFGEKEPGKKELEAARRFCRGLGKAIYEEIPFYKKPAFNCLNVYR